MLMNSKNLTGSAILHSDSLILKGGDVMMIIAMMIAMKADSANCLNLCAYLMLGLMTLLDYHYVLSEEDSSRFEKILFKLIIFFSLIK